MTAVELNPAALRPRPAPWYLTLPAWLCAAGTALPIFYLLWRAAQVEPDVLREQFLRPRSISLLLNTAALAATVLAATALLGIPMAWLTTRCHLPARRLWTLLAVLPLAVPGYLMAYALLSIGGENGALKHTLGLSIPRISGFLGSAIALSLYNLPYMYLNLRVAMQRMDPALEETARTLGHSRRSTFLRVILPQLKPALLAAGLLVLLHVVGDFGVVSLMRFDTLSYALFQQVESNNRSGAAWIALALVAATSLLLVLEFRFLRGLRLDPAGMSAPRRTTPIRLGRWKLAAFAFLTVIALPGLLIPIGTILFWASRLIGSQKFHAGSWVTALVHTLAVAIPTALVTTALAIPLAYLARRYPSRTSHALERSTYLGYATPPLAFALGFVFFGIHGAPFLYQSFAILITAYALRFLAEAIGPLRSALYAASPRVVEAARTLGCGRWAAFRRVTLPMLKPGLTAGASLVFLSTMKELPITYILAPLDFSPLALRVWDYTNEARFAEAAPLALTILLVSAAFVGLLLARGHEAHA